MLDIRKEEIWNQCLIFRIKNLKEKQNRSHRREEIKKINKIKS